ncbi:MAG: sulfurtransferase, partial [Moorea sp. SIO3I7]|nr:sulfurtransferase [Moorena sp. SIO3I7]
MRAQLLKLGEKHAVKGTVLLAEEGINLALSSPPAAVEDFCAELRSVVRAIE